MQMVFIGRPLHTIDDRIGCAVQAIFLLALEIYTSKQNDNFTGIFNAFYYIFLFVSFEISLFI